MLSQFEDLQQCYLRLRKSGKTPAATASLPVSPFQQGTAELGGNEPPSKRVKQEHQPADSTPAVETTRDGLQLEVGVSPAEPSAAVATASQVRCCLHACVAAHVCAVLNVVWHDLYTRRLSCVLLDSPWYMTSGCLVCVQVVCFITNVSQ